MPKIDLISRTIYRWAAGRDIGIMHFATGYLTAYTNNDNGDGINFKGVSHNDYFMIKHNVLFWYPLKDEFMRKNEQTT